MGNLSISKTRESLNKLKVKLINNLLNESPGGIKSARKTNFANNNADEVKKSSEAVTHLMVVDVTQFCPYFCCPSDLDGKIFSRSSSVKRREVMSPFNMHYSVHNMIELTEASNTFEAQRSSFHRFGSESHLIDASEMKPDLDQSFLSEKRETPKRAKINMNRMMFRSPSTRKFISVIQTEQSIDDFCLSKLQFKTFAKTQMTINWTLLKVSFEDVKILQALSDHNIQLVT